jgi:glucosylceramidase
MGAARGPGGTAAGAAATLLLAGATLLVAAVIIALVVHSPPPARATVTNPLAVSVVQTDSPAGEDLSVRPGETLTSTAPAAGTPVINVNTSVHYQRISGFGAAMTDSSASLIERDLSAGARNRLMAELFSPEGLDLSVLRIPIGASDFTANGVPYSYDDGSPDPTLKRFSIAHDDSYMLPSLQQALAENPNLQFLATPWSVPAWMKANDSLNDVGSKGTLLAGDYGVYGNYIVKFLQAYAAAGIHVSEITPANEPGNPTDYPGMNISAASEAELINADLATALHRAGLHVKIYGSDLGWASEAYAQSMAQSQAIRNLAGIAWHCYYGDPNVMSQVRALDPQLGVLMTECSPGISTVPISEIVIGSLRNWASQVNLWNVALDPEGGPVQAPNRGCGGCSGLVTINPKGGAVTFNTAAFQLGQASEFIEPGAYRVQSNSFVTYDYTKPNVNYISPGIDDVAAVNPDGSVALMAYNNSPDASTFAVHWHSYSFSYTLAPGATVSFRWR